MSSAALSSAAARSRLGPDGGDRPVGLLHIRYALEPRFGSWWPGAVAGVVVAADVAHSYPLRL
jgi:hypothetical protein